MEICRKQSRSWKEVLSSWSQYVSFNRCAVAGSAGEKEGCMVWGGGGGTMRKELQVMGEEKLASKVSSWKWSACCSIS